MPMRSEQGVFDDVAQQLGARQLAGIEVQPLPELRTRGVLVAAVERFTDVGEEVAELPEA